MAASDQIKKELFKKGGGAKKKLSSGNYFEKPSIFGNFIWVYN